MLYQEMSFKNIEEVNSYFDNVLPNNIKDIILLEENLSYICHDLGKWMWGESELKTDIIRKTNLIHPDDIALVILQSYSKHLQDLSLNKKDYI
jgi:hypothetical protein